MTLPPGLLKLATSPAFSGSPLITIGMVGVAVLAASTVGSPAGHVDYGSACHSASSTLATRGGFRGEGNAEGHQR